MQYISEDFTCRWEDGGKIRVQARLPGRFNIYWSSSPDGFTDDNELEPFEGTTLFDNPLKKRRCFLHIVGASRYSVTTPRILIPNGRCNLRDLGGYNTQDGSRFIRHGVLYRSSRPATRDRELVATLKEISPRLVVDFRFLHEIELEDDNAVIEGARVLRCCPADEARSPEFAFTRSDMEKKDLGDIHVLQQALDDAYTTMPFGSRAYRDFMRAIVQNPGTVLYHCSAGKDRTGMASAMIMLALGVPQQAIVEDYMLSGAARAVGLEERLLEYSNNPSHTPQQVAMWHRYLTMSETAIIGMLEAIRSRYAHMEDYFAAELQISRDDLETMRETYLIKHNIETR